MAVDFPRTLLLLRKEKGISQRKVAEELGISQALLSHYENGAREPGFDFLIRVADYYQVSTDYMLGLTMSRERGPVAGITDVASDGDRVVSGSMLANLQRRIITNSLTLIYDLVIRCNNKPFTDNITKYLTLAIYKIFRFIYMANPASRDALFSVPGGLFSEMCDVEIAKAQLDIKTYAIKSSDKNSVSEAPEISYDMLRNEYPALNQSMLALMHMAGEYLSVDGEKNNS